jgi:hypothetical protein
MAVPVEAPDAGESLEAEVVRLRRMVHALAEMLVECGVLDASMVEGRLRLASVAPEPLHPSMQSFSIKKPGLWTRLFGKETKEPVGAIPAVMMPVDQTVPVQKMPFEVKSLYDESGGPSVVAPGMTLAARAAVGNCARCWRRVPLNAAQLCARCSLPD